MSLRWTGMVPDFLTNVGEAIPAALRHQLVSLRRDLHQHPELAFREKRTSSLLVSQLSDLGSVTISRVGDTGIVARIPGRDRTAPCVAIRGDIDALPIQEATGLPFSSVNPGVMHACGHDVHAAWTFGAAALLSAEPADGDVLIVFQPAEETGEGALAILNSGAIDNVDAIFGAHVDRRFAVGSVVAQAGPVAASADAFEVELTAKGAHGARPHESADPIVAIADVIGAIQTIVSRRVNPAMPAVVTIGKVFAGTASNVIPDRAVLSGTLRATDEETRTLLQTELRHIIEHVAAAHRTEAHITIGPGVPPVINTKEASNWAAEAAIETLGANALVSLGAVNMAAEDFAWYLRDIPGCFLRIGARLPDEPVIPAHSPKFDVAEEAILVGALVLGESARRASRSLSGRQQ